jgi:hypothetical protein
MQELLTAIPDVQMLLALTPEELAAKILFLLRKRREETFHQGNLHIELWNQYSRYNSDQPPQYPREKEHDITIAIDEAWAWLVSQGFLIPIPDGWVRLSRRARAMESEADFASLRPHAYFPVNCFIRSLRSPYGWRSCAASMTLPYSRQ